MTTYQQFVQLSFNPAHLLIQFFPFRSEVLDIGHALVDCINSHYLVRCGSKKGLVVKSTYALSIKVSSENEPGLNRDFLALWGDAAPAWRLHRMPAPALVPSY